MGRGVILQAKLMAQELKRLLISKSANFTPLGPVAQITLLVAAVTCEESFLQGCTTSREDDLRWFRLRAPQRIEPNTTSTHSWGWAVYGWRVFHAYLCQPKSHQTALPSKANSSKTTTLRGLTLRQHPEGPQVWKGFGGQGFRLGDYD